MSLPRSSTGFSPEVAAVLSQADRGIRARMGNHHALFDYWRFAMGTICSVQAFYVGFYREGRKIVYPYTFDDTLQTKEFVPPEVLGYGPGGQAAFILAHRRPYTYAEDNGALLRHGVSFGDERRASADAVTIPVFDKREEGPAIIGLASIQTYQPRAYTREHVRAFEWTARSVSTVLAREREDDLNREELEVPAGTPQGEQPSVVEVVQDVSEILRSLHARICAVEDAVPVGERELYGLVRELRRRCEQAQTETMDIISRPSVHAETLLNSLSSKEREIALLIARGGMTNKEIAAAVFVTESTIKGHVSRILRKLGVEQRSGIAVKLDEFVG
ncbi:helix-turn-helix transcriptional regulator [Sphaerisporangium sp. TRM90804]|uniref:helix-turn-helix transcriptional regulator n=1 Tax=Sphaerisporangium sp. TRM90804 TaxID=3031113 RepID=UPI00244CC04B|nr:helix-turn-helix transcriptional regulator [Sphaerisporangium sp. TRM90804]MDH2424650.1 helix-turn-helix transcriptional regulator [Sphaerisporangium sp. TRM90804]